MHSLFLVLATLLVINSGQAAPSTKTSAQNFDFLTFCGPFMEELQRMDFIHRDPDRHEGKSRYFDNRDDSDYRRTLIGYGRILRELQEKGGVALDIGAGQAIAAQTAVTSPHTLHPDFKMIAVDVFRPLLGRFLPSLFRDRAGQFEYLEGHYLEEYFAPDAEARGLVIPPADFISDYFGGASYGLHFDKTIEFELRTLKVGRFLTLSLYHENTVIHGSVTDRPVKNLIRWFSNIKGARIVERIVDDRLFNILLEKTGKEIVVQPLEVLSFDADQPPWRSYLPQK